MAIAKNTKPAAPVGEVQAQEAPVVTPVKAAAPKKAATKKPVATPASSTAQNLPPKAESPRDEPAKVGRKELAEAIRAIVAHTGMAISSKVAGVAVVAYEQAIQEALASGAQVTLPGFGVFSSVPKAEQKRPNPQKPGEFVIVKAHNAPKFKIGSKLKAAVNVGNEDAGEGGDDE